MVVSLRHDLHSVTVVIDDMVCTWAPDDFWQLAQPLIPVPAARPQGGGKRRVSDRAVLAAIVYLVQAGCSWHNCPRRCSASATQPHTAGSPCATADSCAATTARPNTFQAFADLACTLICYRRLTKVTK
jgi:transposase